MGYSLSGYSAAPTPIGNNRFEQVIKAELALAAWRWGHQPGGHLGMVAIAHCLANRFRKGWNTWLGVVDGIPKYAATIDIPRGVPDAWDRNFLKLLVEIDGIVDGTAKDITNGGLYFADTTNVTNDWFLENVARSPNHSRVADMNSLTFWN